MSRSINAFLDGLETGAQVLWRVGAWPFRVAAARRALAELAGFDDRELADIGLVRQDLRDVCALALADDPTEMLAARAGERRRRRDCVPPPRGPGGPKALGGAIVRLTGALAAPICSPASRPDGRRLTSGGKSGLHGDTAPDNVRRGRPQGQRHRKQTAGQGR
jgi:uncharacterized protein YjiS (DUF1127 family)